MSGPRVKAGMKAIAVTMAAAAATGVLFCLALPPADQWWIGWFAFVPLLVAARGRGFLHGFLGGILAMLVCALFVWSGVFYSDKDMSGSMSWVVTGCALFGFVISMSAGIWADKGTLRKPSIWFAALAVALEACLMVKLPAHIALTQYRQPAMLFLASLGGIWLVSLLMWFANFGLAAVIERARGLDREARKEREWVGGHVWAFGLLAAGLVLVGLLQLVPRASGTLRVAAIQTDSADERVLSRLHLAASKGGSRFVVWPEFSAIIMAPGGNTARLEKLAAEPGSAPIVTSYQDGFQPLPHNTSALFSASGVSAKYYKRQLLGGEANMHTPGDRAVCADTDFGAVGLAICYDSCFPEAMRETALLPNVVVMSLPAVDPPSPHHFVAAVHAAFTPFRAAEDGVPIVRSDGFAHSMIVDGSGRIVADMGAGEGFVEGAVPPPHPTLYRRIGDVVLYLCAAFGLAGFFLFRGSRVQRR